METNKGKNTKKLMLVLLGAFILVTAFASGTGLQVSTEFASAATGSPNSTTGVRIDGWEVFQNMEVFGQNLDGGCGITAMAILLQYYSEYAAVSGKILSES